MTAAIRAAQFPRLGACLMAPLPPVLCLRIIGLPVAQARAKTRLFRNARAPLGVTTSHYEPENVRDWKRTVQGQVLPHRPPAPVEGPLAVTLTFHLPRPVSLPKRVLAHTKKPDLDNLVKAIKDALRGVVYRDDAQIVQLIATKAYDPSPGVGIAVEHIFFGPTPAPLPAAGSPDRGGTPPVDNAVGNP